MYLFPPLVCAPFPFVSSSRINTRIQILPFSFQVQRDLHGVDVRLANWIDDIHVRKNRFGAVGLAKHRRKHRGPIGGHKEQTKGGKNDDRGGTNICDMLVTFSRVLHHNVVFSGGYE